MSVKIYEGQLFKASQHQLVHDHLAEEGALQININNKPFSTTMRSPGSDDALIRGLLFSEDVYRAAAQPSIQYRTKNEVIRMANVSLPIHQIGSGFKNNRSLLSVSSCGICGKQGLDEVSSYKACLNDTRKIAIASVYRMFDIMQAGQADFKLSGGSHAAAAFNASAQLLSIQEDIGRHNAVDKVVGDLLIQKQLSDAVILLVSGRISYEIVAKTYAAAIPVLAAVSAPSSLAVEYAKQFGLTLLGFSRGQKTTCYANPWRLSTGL